MPAANAPRASSRRETYRASGLVHWQIAGLRWHCTPIFAHKFTSSNFCGNPFSEFFSGIGATLTFYKVRYPVEMGWQADIEVAGRNKLN
jgi:hypothetical protein